MQRRSFLKLAGYFSVVLQLPASLSGCGANNPRAAQGEMAFLHGVASADPTDVSVVLWTRVTPLQDDSGYVTVTVQLASDDAFDSLLVESQLRIDESSDYTLRFKVSGLQSDSIYYYRFIANDSVFSATGRTWTAPALDAVTPVNFASINCQDREHGFYTVYALMLKEDEQKARNEQIRFILHLGDFIYETRNDALQYPVDITGQQVKALLDSQDQPRVIEPFPDGGILGDGTEYALSLRDYRHLYKNYLLDPDLQAARARWPFIHVWDDHEFTDDCWQTEANYDDTGIRSTSNEPSQPRKLAANQAWYEYIPVDYEAPAFLDSSVHQAHAFQPQSVGTTENDTFDANGLANNRDNLAALASLTIYRSLRFGRNLQLVLTDCRSYRSDHPLPEDISGNFSEFIDPRLALPVALVNTLDAGREANHGEPPYFLDLPVLLKNPRRESPPGTMLGEQQKQWWKTVMRESRAQWKVWVNSVPLMRLGVDLSALPVAMDDIILSSDAWDGYNHERRELMEFLYAQQITNVVSIAGDLHAAFAGKVFNDYDEMENRLDFSIPEFVCSSVSSISQFLALDRLSIRENPDDTEKLLRQLIVYEDKATAETICNFNTTLLRGAATAIQAAQTADKTAVLPVTTSAMNPHLRYADTNTHGYALFSVGEESFTAEMVSVDNIQIDPREQPPKVLRRAGFELAAQDSPADVALNGPVFNGTPPYPETTG